MPPVNMRAGGMLDDPASVMENSRLQLLTDFGHPDGTTAALL